MPNQDIIDVDISVKAGSFQLDLAFTSEGQFTSLFGPSGSGKTTALRALAGLCEPSRGTINVRNELWYDKAKAINKPVHGRHCGFVFQDSALFDHMTVDRNINYAKWAVGRKSKFDDAKIIDILGIRSLLDRYPRTLSGGERQRVSLARALNSSPELLLLDEPFSALDEERKREIYPFFDAIKANFDIPILFVSHSTGELFRLADNVVLLDGGRVSSFGKVEEVFADRQIQSISLLSGKVISNAKLDGFDTVDVEGQPVVVSGGNLSKGTFVRLGVSSNEVILANAIPSEISAQNCVRTTIGQIDLIKEHSAMIHLHLGRQVLRSQITRKSLNDMGLEAGKTCFALIKAIALSEKTYV